MKDRLPPRPERRPIAGVGLVALLTAVIVLSSATPLLPGSRAAPQEPRSGPSAAAGNAAEVGTLVSQGDPAPEVVIGTVPPLPFAPASGRASINMTSYSETPSSGLALLNVTFSATVHRSVGNSSGLVYTFAWSFGGAGAPGQSDLVTPSAGSTQATDTVVHQYNIGSYAPSLLVTDSLGDNQSERPGGTITVFDPFRVVLTPSRTIATLTVPVEISLNISGGVAPYRSSWAGSALPGCVTTLLQLSCTETATGNYTAVATVSDSFSHHFNVSVAFTVEPALLAVASSTQQYYCNGSVQALVVNLTATAIGGTLPYTYRWSFGDHSPNASGLSVQHDYALGASYNATVNVTDAGGGIQVATVVVSASSSGCAAGSGVRLPTGEPIEGGAIALVIAAVVLVLLLRRSGRKGQPPAAPAAPPPTWAEPPAPPPVGPA